MTNLGFQAVSHIASPSFELLQVEVVAFACTIAGVVLPWRQVIFLPAPCGSSRYCIAVQRCRKHEHRDPGLVPGSGAGPVACTKGQYRFSRGPATLASAPLSLVPPQKARSAAVQGSRCRGGVYRPQ